MSPLSDAHRAQIDAVRGKVLRFVGAVWSGMPNYRRDAIETRFLDAVVPVVKAGQIQVAEITNAYLLAQAKQLGIGMKAATVDADKVTGLRPVTYAEEYSRPATSVYAALAEGQGFDQAKKLGAGRLMSLVATDLQMSYVHQARATMKGGAFTFFTRIPRGVETCALCLVASTQRYRRGNLMPIHPGCDCGMEIHKGDVDPGQILQPEQLEKYHAAVAAKTGTDAGSWEVFGGRDARGIVDYRKLLAVREHGEYGPTLTWLGDRFTGPTGIN